MKGPQRQAGMLPHIKQKGPLKKITEKTRKNIQAPQAQNEIFDREITDELNPGLVPNPTNILQTTADLEIGKKKNSS